VNSQQLLRRNRIRPYLPDDTVLDAEAGAYNSPIIKPDMAKTQTPKKGKQQTLGGETDPPPAIQAIDNACEELFDIADERKTFKERYQKAEINVMGLMRAAGRVIYKYRDRMVKVDSSERLKIQAPKKPRKPRRGGAGEDRIGRDD
jgi:hypothetical protein